MLLVILPSKMIRTGKGSTVFEDLAKFFETVFIRTIRLGNLHLPRETLFCLTITESLMQS